MGFGVLNSFGSTGDKIACVHVCCANQYTDRMLKGSLKLIKEAKKGKKVVDEKEEREAEESEKQEENLIPEDLNKGESEEEERLLQKKVD